MAVEGEWRQGGVNVARAVRAVWQVIDETTSFPDDALNQLVRSGIALQSEQGQIQPSATMWSLADRLGEVVWKDLLDEACEKRTARLSGRLPNDVTALEASSALAAIWTAVSVESRRPGLPPSR